MHKMRKELQHPHNESSELYKSFCSFSRSKQDIRFKFSTSTSNKIFISNFHLYTPARPKAQGDSGCAKAYVKLSAKDLEECCEPSV